MSRDVPEPYVVLVGDLHGGKAAHLVKLGLRTRLVDQALDDEADPDVVLVPDPRQAPHLLASLGTRAPIWVDLAQWDGNPDELHDALVDSADCLFLSDIELDDPLRTAERLLPGKELVVITHGRRGATAFFPDTEPFFVLPHDEGPVVDVRGARDAFCSGTAYGFRQGWDWPRALRAGAVVAGGCVGVPGAADPGLSIDWLVSRL